MRVLSDVALGLGVLTLLTSAIQGRAEPPLTPAEPGYSEITFLTPEVVQLSLVTAGRPDVRTWDYAGNGKLPAPAEFNIMADGKPVRASQVGFLRRVSYAPLKTNDLRVLNCLFLKLAQPVATNSVIDVTHAADGRWPAKLRFNAKFDPNRWSPVIHVNQTGYLRDKSKQAMVGYYLGSLGELDGSMPSRFNLIDARTGKSVFEGSLKARPDRGFPYPAYQKVLQADFTPFDKEGDYRIAVPGLGRSFAFMIGDSVAGAFARTYALGLYHQRCGTANELPYTRFTHKPCHMTPAEVPTLAGRYESANHSLEKETENFKEDPKHTAPRLKNVSASLYPFVARGPVDVSGGHHDAGDYSKYTINSAGFIHHLVFAVDSLPGVVDLDNLGLPESGDGKSDVLQEAKWESDFLAKMQDSDGGFYFLVYPREREYENDVLPDKGDPQIVFPKTTSATAAATAALAQCAASPAFTRQFPEAASAYLKKALRGWEFLERAMQKHGFDGSYQKITHYGDQFRHDDELAWAATELFLATGDARFAQKAQEWLRPDDPATRKWGWLRLFDAYGCAIRSYAFGARSGRLKVDQLNAPLLQQCEDELVAAAEDHLQWAEASAYGTSLPEPTKRSRSAGWYFSTDAAFDLAVASQLPSPPMKDRRPAYLEAILSNLNYEQGCNPVNVTYVTGLGWKRQFEIVHQYAQNDRRELPPTGIPLGNVQEGLGWLEFYKDLPGKLSFPPDGVEQAPYPFYDRWSDGFNLSQEFVILHQARGLAYLAWIMAATPLKKQDWKSAPARIAQSKQGDSTVFQLSAGGLPLAGARTVWEGFGMRSVLSEVLKRPAGGAAPAWLEAECQLPDGRRAFGVLENATRLSSQNEPTTRK